MTIKQLIEQLSKYNGNDAVVVTRGNSDTDFKITHVTDSTMAGVVEIRYNEFKTDNPWEND